MGTEKNKSGRHPFKWLKYEGQKVRIDKDIAPLLSGMWKLGIYTTNSCQATYHWTICSRKTKECKEFVWIVFETAKDIERFYDYVAVWEPLSDIGSGFNMYEKMSGIGYGLEPHSVWYVLARMDNLGVEGHWKRNGKGKNNSYTVWEEDGCKKNQFVLQPQLWFPRKHLSYVEERIKLALK